MLEKPGLDEDRLIAHLRTTFGLPIAAIDFLPLGADANTAVYRAMTGDGAPYFVKLRAGAFEELSVMLPAYLHNQGMAEIIAPLPTLDRRTFSRIAAYAVIVYPFVTGEDGYTVELTDAQWSRFGVAMHRLHTVTLPPALHSRLPRVAFSARWRDAVMHYLQRATTDRFADPLAADLAAFLRANRDETLDLLRRSAHSATLLQERPLDLVVCHTDIHAGNLLIAGDGSLYIVDWDNPTLAPKERDLMFIGGAQGFAGRSAAEELDRFYCGYGATELDPVALAYFRYERILEDIALYCDDIWSSNDDSADRRQALAYMKTNFRPDGAIAAAIVADPNHMR
jgi:spectinomycin phosphotransferase